MRRGRFSRTKKGPKDVWEEGMDKIGAAETTLLGLAKMSRQLLPIGQVSVCTRSTTRYVRFLMGLSTSSLTHF